jgi:transposase
MTLWTIIKLTTKNGQLIIFEFNSYTSFASKNNNFDTSFAEKNNNNNNNNLKNVKNKKLQKFQKFEKLEKFEIFEIFETRNNPKIKDDTGIRT